MSWARYQVHTCSGFNCMAMQFPATCICFDGQVVNTSIVASLFMHLLVIRYETMKINVQSYSVGCIACPPASSNGFNLKWKALMVRVLQVYSITLYIYVEYLDNGGRTCSICCTRAKFSACRCSICRAAAKELAQPHGASLTSMYSSVQITLHNGEGASGKATCWWMTIQCEGCGAYSKMHSQGRKGSFDTKLMASYSEKLWKSHALVCRCACTQ